MAGISTITIFVALHPWCRDVARDEAVRAAEDGRLGPLPTLEECISSITFKGDDMTTKRDEQAADYRSKESERAAPAASCATLARIAAAFGCVPDDDCDLVEAARLLVRERDQALAQAASGAEPVALSIGPAELDGLQAIDDGLRRHGNGFVVTPGSDSDRAVRSILDRHTPISQPDPGSLALDARMERILRTLPLALRGIGFFNADDVVAWAAREIDLLRESLAIFVHAHATGNSVPPHIEAAARSLVNRVSPGPEGEG